MQYLITHNYPINLLHDYLIKEVPTFHRVTSEAGGMDYALDDCGSVSQLGDDITISFADDLPLIIVQTALASFKN